MVDRRPSRCARLVRAGIAATAALCALAGGAAEPGARWAQPANAPALPRIADEPALGKGVLLVASRELRDPNFSRAVVLVLDYGEGGAMGLVINRPTDLRLAHLLPDLERIGRTLAPVYLGGPVGRERILLLVRAPEAPVESSHVLDDLYLSASRTTLEALVGGPDPGAEFHAYAGYAGWGPGQLEGEMSRGDWLLARASAAAVFRDDPEHLWPELIRQSAGRWVRGAPPVRSSPPRCASAPQVPCTTGETLAARGG